MRRLIFLFDDPRLKLVADVTITYCLPCHCQSKAIQDADGILKELGKRLTVLRLVPGDHGVDDVVIDGDLVFSLDREAHFPEASDLVERIRSRLAGPA